MSEANYAKTLINLSREALDNLPFGAYVIDKNGIILFFNKQMTQMSGVEDAKEIEGQNVFEIPSYKKYGLLDFIKRGLDGKPFRLKGIQYVSHIGKRESYRDYYGIPIKDDQGNVEKLLCIVEDMTERKKLENQIIEEIKEKEDAIKEIRERVDADMGKIHDLLTNTKGFIVNKS